MKIKKVCTPEEARATYAMLGAYGEIDGNFYSSQCFGLSRLPYSTRSSGFNILQDLFYI